MRQISAYHGSGIFSRNILFTVNLFFILLLNIVYSSAATYSPNIFSDPVFTIVNNATGAMIDGPGAGSISLRSAITAADNSGGANTITLSAGTYNVTEGYIFFGSAAQNFTINGVNNSPLTTIINMVNNANTDRIFFITFGSTANVVTTFNYIKFTNGHLNSDAYGGGAIRAGGLNEILNINNCEFNNNTIDANAGTTGGAINFSGGGALNITNSLFTNNSNDNSDGGAVYYFFQNFPGLTGSLNITNCTFSNNTATVTGPGNGGAIGIATQGRISPFDQTFTANITENTFINNSAPGGAGGAIIVDNGDASYAINILYNRFFNNSTSTTTAATSGLAMNAAAGSVIAVNNWWGCNTDPSTAGACNRAAIIGGASTGTLTTSPWLELKMSASPNTICPTVSGLGNTSTATASFLTNSANTAINTANLDALKGVTISFVNPVLGSLSSAQSTIQNSGTATVLFTSNGTPGSASVNAVVDNVPNTDVIAKASITVNALPSIAGGGQPVNVKLCSTGTANFNVTTSGGTAPLVFKWFRGVSQLSNGATGTGSTISGAGTNSMTISNATTADNGTDYHVEISNSCGNISSNNASLSVYTPPVSVNASVTQPDCITPTGKVTASATAALGTLEYQLSPFAASFQSSNIFSGINPSTSQNLTVRIAELTSCSTVYSSNPININAAPSLTINSVTVTQPTCALPTGSIDISASSTGGGVIEYSIDLANANWTTANSFIGFTPGNYNVKVRNTTTGCTATYVGNPVVINPVPLPPVVNAPNVTQPTCATPTGTIVVNATGGDLEYSIDNGASWHPSNSFPGLTPGDYNVVVRLENNPTCFTAYSGNPVTILSIQEINIKGGAPPLTIADGDVTPSSTDNTSFGTTNIGLPVSKTFTIENTGGNILHVTSIFFTGAAGDFSFSGISLPAAINAGGSVTFNIIFSPTATGLRSATININNDDCDELIYDFSVEGNGINIPATITCPVAATEGTCQKQSVIDTKFSAWLATATFNGGCNTTLINDNTGAPSACGGSTTVKFTVTSSCGPNFIVTCTSSFTVLQTPPGTLTCPIAQNESSCQTQSEINTKYTNWLNSAVASNGCTVTYNSNSGAPSAITGGVRTITFSALCASPSACTSTFSIAQPIQLTLSHTNVTCSGGVNGTANVSVSGGNAPYHYLWTPGNTTGASITGSAAQTYSITVTDAKGCSKLASVTITEPALLSNFQHIGILSLEFHVDKLSRPLL